jgi:hypothetical protein
MRLNDLASWLAAACLLLSPSLARAQAPTPERPPPRAGEEAHDVALEQAAPAPPPPPAIRPGDPPPGQVTRGPPLEPPRWRVGATLGAGTSYGHSYVMFGGLVGYELGSGFEASFDGQFWGGAKPNMGKLAPGINWYAPIPFRPYVGVYYARWIIGGGYRDEDAVGARFGATLTSTPSAAFGAGMVYERILGCSVQCDSFWPELSFGFRF